jgi:hypothetical protein
VPFSATTAIYSELPGCAFRALSNHTRSGRQLIGLPDLALQVVQFFRRFTSRPGATFEASFCGAAVNHFLKLELCRPWAVSSVDCLFPQPGDAVLPAFFPVPALASRSHPAHHAVGITQLGHNLVNILELLRGPLRLSLIPSPLPASLAIFKFFFVFLSRLERPLYLSDLDLELFYFSCASSPQGVGFLFRMVSLFNHCFHACFEFWRQHSFQYRSATASESLLCGYAHSADSECLLVLLSSSKLSQRSRAGHLGCLISHDVHQALCPGILCSLQLNLFTETVHGSVKLCNWLLHVLLSGVGNR